jgi:excisionase family DNA binding protein
MAASMSVQQAADYIGISVWALYRMIHSGKFYPAIYIGNRYRVSTVKLDEYLQTGGAR